METAWPQGVPSKTSFCFLKKRDLLTYLFPGADAEMDGGVSLIQLTAAPVRPLMLALTAAHRHPGIDKP